MTGNAVITYLQEIAKPLQRILGSFDIKVTRKLTATLSHIFAKLKNANAKEQGERCSSFNLVQRKKSRTLSDVIFDAMFKHFKIGKR